MPVIDRIANVVPSNLALSVSEFRALLEIAFLAIAADRTIHPDEERALRRVARRLRANVSGGTAADVPPRDSEAEVDALFERLGTGLERDAADARLRALGAELTEPRVRGLAYKVAYALAMADLAAPDEEFEFDLELIDALAIPQESVDALTSEVVSVLQGD